MAKKDDLLKAGIAGLGGKASQVSAGLADLLHKKEEFSFIPLGQIVTEKQVRSVVDTESDAFKALVESIKEKGVLEPVLVKDTGTNYLLVAGERRFRASESLNLQSIPARIFDKNTSREEILEIQLIENLHRENLNPIDEAQGYLEFCRTRLGKESLPPVQVINNLILYDRGQADRLDKEFVVTVTTLLKVSGKSVPSLKNIFSLLKLPDMVKSAMRGNKIGATQGYILAANLEHEDFEAIFKNAVGGAYTKDALTQAFKNKPSGGQGRAGQQGVAVKYLKSLAATRAAIEKNIAECGEAERSRMLEEARRIVEILT